MPGNRTPPSVRPANEGDALLLGSGSGTTTALLQNNHDDQQIFITDGDAMMKQEFVGDPWRYVVVVAFCLLGTSNGAAWLTFGPIVEEVKEYFDITSYEVNMLTSMYLFVYFIGANINCITYQKIGLRGGLIVAAVFNVLCTVTKLVAILFMPRYELLVLSMVFGALTEVLIISVPPLITNTWFLVEERTVLTGLTSNFVNLGIGIGMVMPPLMVNPHNKDQAAFLKLFVVQAIWAGVAFVAITFGVPKRPKTPPSFAADAMAEMEQVQLIPSIKQLAKNRSFLLLAVLSSAVVGVVWGISGLLPQVLLPFGVSEGNTGWMGFANMVSGSVVASVACYFIGKSGHLKGTLVTLGGLLVAVLGLWLLLLRTKHEAAVPVSYVCYIVIGFFTNTMFPIIMELGVELTYPISEEVASTALLWAPTVSSMVLIQVMSAVLGNSPDINQASLVIVVCIVVITVGVAAMLFVVPIHKRQEFEAASAESGSPKHSPSLGNSPYGITPTSP